MKFLIAAVCALMIHLQVASQNDLKAIVDVSVIPMDSERT